MFPRMKETMIFCVVLTLIVQTRSLQVDTMDTYKTTITVKDPSWGSMSSGILKSHSGISYTSNLRKTLTISAPNGYGLLAAFKFIDLRPNRQDSITLFVQGAKGPTSTYSNGYSFRDRQNYPYENGEMFYAPNGQLGVTFNTGTSFFTVGYDGFELTYTVQANWTKCKNADFHCSNGRCIADILTCDGHNHCGDRSDQQDCYVSIRNPTGKIIGIVGGVMFLIAVISIIYILIRRSSRSRIEERTVISHPPPTNLPSYPPSYPQPGTCYPPPPPPYNQGMTNPGYH